MLKGKVKVLNAQPGIFTVTQNGKGAGAVACQVVTKDADGKVISNSYPPPPCEISAAMKDGYLLLFGTGFKFATPTSVVVQVGTGDTAKDYIPVYAGSQNQFPGLDQINLLLPTDFPQGTLKLKIKASSGSTAVESNEFEVTVK